MRTHKIIFAVWTVLQTHFLFSQTGNVNTGSISDAMGGASVAMSNVYSAENNQAGMAFISKPTVGLATENYFAIQGLNSYHADVVLPTKNAGSFGVALNYFGDNNFNQTKLGIGYAKKLADQFSLGIMIDYIGTKIAEAGSGNAFTFEAGIQYNPSKHIVAAATIYNPVRVKMGNELDEELPSYLTIGLKYIPSEKVSILLEAEQELNEVIRFKGGLEYHIIDLLYVRAGYKTDPNIFTAGIGLQLKDFIINISSQFHPQLGISPGLDLLYQF